jgi:uncharacterized membrane protein
MSLGRLLLVFLVLAGGLWLAKTQHLFGPPASTAGDSTPAPTDRARAAARASAAREAQTEAATQNVEAPATGRVSENMTPEQVRALLGPADSVDSETSDSGVARERWTYRSVGKTVVFENGVVARIE